MATWRRGRQLVAERIRRGERSVTEVIDEPRRRHHRPRHRRVPLQGRRPGAARPDQQPPPQQGPPRRDLPRRHRRHRRPPRRRRRRGAAITTLRPGLHQVRLRFGYLDELDVPAELALVELDGRAHRRRPTRPTSSAGRPSSQGDLEGMHPALEHLYTLLHRGADSATRFFNLPAGPRLRGRHPRRALSSDGVGVERARDRPPPDPGQPARRRGESRSGWAGSSGA